MPGLARPVTLLLTILALLAPEIAVAGGGDGGKIEEARDRMDDDDRVRDHRSDSDDDSDDDDDGDFDSDDDSDDDDDDVIAELTWYAITSPFWGPAVAAGDLPYPRPYQFAAYPYEDGRVAGYHRVELPPTQSNPWQVTLRTAASYENHFDDLEGRRLRVDARTNKRLSLEGEVTRYDEPLSGGAVDHLWHYKAMASYSFAVSPRVHFDSGIGFRALRWRAGDTRVDFNWRYRAEFFPVRPVHLWLSAELGGSGNGVASELEAGLGVSFNRVEAFVGIRHFRIVGLNFSGPQAGVAVWL